MQVLKIVAVGPLGVGKTTVSNLLADIELGYDYRPTQGVRILEFDVENVKVKNTEKNVEIQLWDCSGDNKFEDCWPALRADAQGVVFVYNKKTDEQMNILENLYDYFADQINLQPKHCVVLYLGDDDNDNSGVTLSKRKSSVFAKISQVNDNNIEENSAKLKATFKTFLGTLMTDMQYKREQEEDKILKNIKK